MEMNHPPRTEHEDAPLDHAVLLAALAAARAAGVAAKAGQGAPPAPVEEDPITEILLAGPGWRRALNAQQGCFNRAEAERRP
ncbi:MAG: hypothetical protein KF780_01130 [Sphingomonas sp.]|nr:hypothetical protein [Sphingomonas sp.]